MIIEELGKFIIIDEIRPKPNASELYFLSCLLGNEMLSLSINWPARIYTSHFIVDILLRKKPKVHPGCLRMLRANVPLKFKCKNKIIWITMFESEETKNSVMFHFDDSINKYLYTGAFNEITSYFRNEKFMDCINKGIDYAYINTVLCNSNPYICTEDTIDEIKTIFLKHPNSKFCVVIPNLGYEKLLIDLVNAFPQIVYPTKTQRYLLTKLGQGEYLSSNKMSSRIFITSAGISTELLETDIKVIYITVGDADTLNNEYGVYIRQWSPLPSLMDQQVLLEKIRPNYIVAIEENLFQENIDLPFNLRSLAKNSSFEIIEPDSYDTDNSISSIETCSSAKANIQVDITSTESCRQSQSSKLPMVVIPTDSKEENKAPNPDKANDKKIVIPLKSINLTKHRIRRNQRTDFAFFDSDDDFDAGNSKK